METPSGIRKDNEGNRIVGGTVRADGSVRKVYKVRPGFTPVEDIAKYRPPSERATNSKVSTLNSKEVMKNEFPSVIDSAKGKFKPNNDDLLEKLNKLSISPKNQLHDTRKLEKSQQLEQPKSTRDSEKIEIKEDILKKDAVHTQAGDTTSKVVDSSTADSKTKYIPPWKR